MPKQSWYEFRAQSAGAVDVLIYDQIGGFGISAAQFVKDLKAQKGKDVNLHINSPGGSVFEGTAIFNALKGYKGKVTTYVDGIAASIGSVVALAGDEVNIASNGYMMIHEAMAVAIMATAADMRKQADVSDKLTATIAQTYADKTGKPLDEIRAAMAAETWFTAQEAVDFGLADTVVDAVEFSNSYDLTKFTKAPAELSARAAATPPPKEITMSVTLDQFKAFAAANPDATKEFHNAGFTAGVEKGKADAAPKPATATELLAAFPADKGFCMDQLAANATLADAYKAFSVEQTKVIKAKDEAITALNDKLAKATTGQGGVAFPGGSGGSPSAADFNAKVKDLTDKGMDRAKAVNAVATQTPDLYAAFLAAANARA